MPQKGNFQLKGGGRGNDLADQNWEEKKKNHSSEETGALQLKLGGCGTREHKTKQTQGRNSTKRGKKKKKRTP